jgi:pimeloyl-ACP methyl ester carboxylesterase
MIEANGVELCTEAFGDPPDPPILLIGGIGASMLWWEEDFCRMLAGGARFVIRYDHRDTGRSVTLFPIEHGEALTEETPSARLLRLEGAGHGVDRADWEVVVEAILDHT